MGVFADLTLAPNLDLLEMAGPSDDLVASIGRNTISGVKEVL
jgi:hypothetical protein